MKLFKLLLSLLLIFTSLLTVNVNNVLAEENEEETIEENIPYIDNNNEEVIKDELGESNDIEEVSQPQFCDVIHYNNHDYEFNEIILNSDSNILSFSNNFDAVAVGYCGPEDDFESVIWEMDQNKNLIIKPSNGDISDNDNYKGRLVSYLETWGRDESVYDSYRRSWLLNNITIMPDVYLSYYAISDNAYSDNVWAKTIHVSPGVTFENDRSLMMCHTLFYEEGWNELPSVNWTCSEVVLPSSIKRINNISGKFGSGIMCGAVYFRIQTAEQLLNLELEGDGFNNEGDFCINYQLIINDNYVREINNFKIPDGIEELRKSVLDDLYEATVYIPKSVKRIQSDTFGKNNAYLYAGTEEEWNNISIEDKNVEYVLFECDEDYFTRYNVKYIDGFSFVYDSVTKTLVVKGDGVLSNVPNLDDFEGLENIEICEGITSIDKESFGRSWTDDVLKLSKLVLPNTLEIIQEDAFYRLRFNKIYLPSSVKKIGQFAFDSFDGYQQKGSIVFYSGNKNDYKSIEIGGYNSQITDATIFYDGKKEAGEITSNYSWNIDEEGNMTFEGSLDWNAGVPWYDFRYAVENLEVLGDTKLIGKEAFMDFKNLKNITIPKSVKYIGPYAFANCKNLKSFTYESDNYIFDKYGYSTNQIDYNAFWGCDSLELVAILGKVQLGSDTFYKCESLKSVYLSSDVLFEEYEWVKDHGYPNYDYRSSSFLGCSEDLIIYTNAKDNSNFGHYFNYIGPAKQATVIYDHKAYLRGVPEDLTISQSSEGNIEIRTNNKSYLENLSKKYKENDALSYVFLENEYLDQTYIFNRINSQDIILNYDEKYAYIDFETLLKYGLKSGVFTVSIISEGYYDKTLDLKIIIPTREKGTITLGETKKLYYEGTDLEWYSTDSEIVSVDNDGVIKAHKIGKAIIGVMDGENTHLFELTVADTTKALTLSFIDAKETGVEIGDVVRCTVMAEDILLENSAIVFKSSNTSVATIDENGVITALAKGSSTITASTKGGSKKTTYKLTVINKQATLISLSAEGLTGVIDEIKNEDNIANVYLNADENINKTYKINVTAYNSDNKQFIPSLSYISSDTSIAAVDKNGVVTIKKAGQVRITVNVTSNTKDNPMSKDLVLRIVDYAPVLESNKLTVNRYLENGADFNIYPVYGKTISKVSLDDGNGYLVAKLNSDGKTFNVKFKDGLYDKLPNTSKNELKVWVNGIDKPYPYDLTITLAQTLPSVKTNVSGNYNTFTGENTLSFNYALTGTVLANFESVKFENNWTTLNNDRTINVTPGNYQGKVTYNFEGYSKGVEQTVTLKTVSTKPAYKLDTTSISLYAKDVVSSKTVTLHLLDKNKQVITSGTVKTNGAMASTATLNNNGDIVLTINEPTKGNIVLSYTGDNWPISSELKYTVKVSLIDKVTAKNLTIDINNKFNTTNEAAIQLSSQSEVVGDVDISGSIEEIRVVFEDHLLKVSTTNAKKGSYKFTITPYLYGEPLKNITLTVKVDDSEPSLKLSKTSVTLNDKYQEVIEGTVTISNNKYAAKLNDLKLSDADKDNFNLDFDSSTLIYKISLKNNNLPKGTYKLPVTPTYSNGVSGKTITMTVKVIDTPAKASISLKGTLNQIDSSSVIVGTVKLTNITDVISEVTIADTTNLKAIVEDGLVKISFNNNSIVDQTIKTTLYIKTKTGAVIENIPVSIKAARTAPKVSLSQTTLNVYDTTNKGEIIGIIDIKQVGNGTIRDNGFWYSESRFYSLELNKDTMQIIVKLKDVAGMKAGSTSKFTIKLDWVGDYGAYSNSTKGIKTSTLTLSVKDASSTVKSK